jgi:heptosyltransferase-1
MRALIVKLSSLGDVINTLPAITDAGHYHQDIQFDWVIEPSFAEVPSWHPLVKKIIPVPLRKWRKQPSALLQQANFVKCVREVRSTRYDFIIDAQGLFKSALVAFFARGKIYGYDSASIREPLSSVFYKHKFAIKRDIHAITRIRHLFAQSLGYAIPDTLPDCGIKKIVGSSPLRSDKYCVFLHGTARDEKLWPENYWVALINYMKELNYKILLPWGNDAEKQRAERLALIQPYVEVLPKSSLSQLANILAHSAANVAVDTGLGHLAAALDVPTISLYGPTKPELNGATGKAQKHLKTNLLTDISAQQVFQELKILLATT